MPKLFSHPTLILRRSGRNRRRCHLVLLWVALCNFLSSWSPPRFRPDVSRGWGYKSGRHETLIDVTSRGNCSFSLLPLRAKIIIIIISKALTTRTIEWWYGFYPTVGDLASRAQGAALGIQPWSEFITYCLFPPLFPLIWWLLIVRHTRELIHLDVVVVIYCICYRLVLQNQHFTRYQQRQQKPFLVNRETTRHPPHYNPHHTHHSPEIGVCADTEDSLERNKYSGHLQLHDRYQKPDEDNIKSLPTVNRPRQT